MHPPQKAKKSLDYIFLYLLCRHCTTNCTTSGLIEDWDHLLNVKAEVYSSTPTTLTVEHLLTSKMMNKSGFQITGSILKNTICLTDKSGCKLSQAKVLH